MPRRRRVLSGRGAFARECLGPCSRKCKGRPDFWECRRRCIEECRRRLGYI